MDPTMMPLQGSADSLEHFSKQDTRHFYLAIASISTVVLMAAVDATSISVAIPTISTDLNGTAIEGFWAGTGFLLTATVFQPIFASFSDIFGRKSVLMVALVLFGVGAVLAAVATDTMGLLLVGRAVQGVGGGGIMVLAEIIITDVVELRKRGHYFAGLAAIWALGSVTGPLIGACFAQKVSWRWIFWINLPFIGVGLPAIAYSLRLNHKPNRIGQKLKQVDWYGMVLFIASTTSFLVPVTWGGVNYPWSAWQTLVPLLVGVAGLLGFVAWEGYRSPEYALIRVRVLMSRTAAINFFGDFIHGLVLWCSLYYYPLYFQVIKNKSPIESAIDLFPASFTVAPAAVVVGAVVTKLGKYRWSIWIGWTLATVGYGLMISLGGLTRLGTPNLWMDLEMLVTAVWVGFTLVWGVGIGMLATGLMFSTQAAATPEDQAYAVSFFTFFRSAGQCLGIAIGGSVFQNSIRHEISKHEKIADAAQYWSEHTNELGAFIDGLRKHDEDNYVWNMINDFLVSYVHALRIVWIVPCGLCFVALVTSLFMQHFSLDMALDTDQGLRHRRGSVDDRDTMMGRMEMA